jgi:hypothetical protein
MLYCTKVLFREQRKRYCRLLSHLDNGLNQIRPIYKHTLVYRCFGNLPQSGRSMA